MNAIGTHLRDPIISGLTRWRMVVLKYAAAELGKNLVSKHQIQPEYGYEQAGAGRNCQARLASPCLADHEQDRQPYPVDPYYWYT